MFRRKAEFKPFSNLKSSERKRLLKAICDIYDLKEDALPTEVKNKILPKDLRSAKVTLHSGDKGIIYADGERPAWISLGDQLIPTLFTLWDCPFLTQYLLTPELTLDRLQNGADLMIPGVFAPYPLHASRGSVVAISTLDSPSVPVAVGIADADCHNISRDMKGKAALTVTVLGDTLMEGYRGGYTRPASLGHTLPVAPAVDESSVEPSLDQDPPQVDELSPTVTENTIEQSHEIVEVKRPQAETFTTQDIDDMFKIALVQVLRLSADKYEPLELPMPGSTLVSQHLLRNLPVQNPEINMKKTSHKKAAKFFKAMEKEKLLTFRERNGEIVVQTIAGLENEAVKSHAVYKVKKTQSATLVKKESSKSQKMLAIQFYKPKSSANGLFLSVSSDPGVAHPSSVLREVLKQYIEDKSLGAGKNIKLDDTLKNALNVKDKAVVPRDKIVELLQANCQVSHKIFNEGDDEPRKTAKGPIPSIALSVERRGGNKVVTIITGIELFHLNPTNIAEELRVACASATSVNVIPHTNDLKEVLVQGPQTKSIMSSLEKKGVKPLWITVNDKTRKKKK